MRTKLAVIAVTAAALVVPASPARAHGTIPKGKYYCYVFYTAGAPSYTGRYIQVKSAKKYRWFDSKKTTGGKFGHDRAKLKFKSGPLKGMRGKHLTYGNGKPGIDITFKTSAGDSDYVCSTR